MALQNQSSCDAFTEQKERNLGELCKRVITPSISSTADVGRDERTAELDVAANVTGYFWTVMLKSGAMNVSERGRLCGLWCAGKEPNCNIGEEDGDHHTKGNSFVNKEDAVEQAQHASGHEQPLAPTPAPSDSWWRTDNYVMRQPLVHHEWSKPNGVGGCVACLQTISPRHHTSQYTTPAPRS